MDMISRAIGPDAVPAGQVSPVNSHNEWDPLEEVIVGRLEGATIPSGHPVVTCNIPGMAGRAQALVAGWRFPQIMIEPAQRELDGFVALLQSLGIAVTRPEPVNHKKRFSTPEWSSRGFCNSCPRDSMLVIGDEIIETPMVWPCRYFETHSYRPILKDYFRRGARWTAAPRPQLTSELFDPEFCIPEKGEPVSSILTEFEPVFDAADFFRCGRDLFVTRSNVTNASGIEWLRAGRARPSEILLENVRSSQFLPAFFAVGAARPRKKNRAAKKYEFEKIACSREGRFLFLLLQRKLSKTLPWARSSASRPRRPVRKAGVSCLLAPDFPNQSAQTLLAES
jgi:hypothetical protein